MVETSPSSSNSRLPNTSLQRYLQPPDLLAPVMAIINSARGWQRDQWFSQAPDARNNPAIIRMIQNQHNLIDDAIAFFSRPHPQAAQRQIPVIEPQASPTQMIASILHSAPGILISIMRDSVWGKKFVIENMHILKQQGVEILYMEHLLSDVHQADLRARQPGSALPSQLNSYLELMDQAQCAAAHPLYSYREVVLAAQRCGIEVIPIDCLASYHLRGLPDPHNNLRQLVMNYYAQRVISNTTRGKWLALMGDRHTNSFNLIPGVAELTRGVSVSIEADSNRPGYIQEDQGRFREDVYPGREHRIKSDLVRTEHRITTLTDSDLDSRIKQPGQFLVCWREETQRFELRYRSRAGKVVATPIQVDNRTVYVENPSPRWVPVNGRRYSSLAALCQDLDIRLGLERVLMSVIPLTHSDSSRPLLEHALQPVWRDYFKRKKNALLLRLSVFASQQERDEFASGKRLEVQELSNMALQQADLPTLMHYFTEPPGTLALRQQGALLARIHVLQAERLTQQSERWAGQITAKGGTWVKRLAHNLYLASAERSIGVCGAISIQVAAAWQLDSRDATIPHLENYLLTFNEAVHSPQTDSSRIFGLSLLEWSCIASDSKFGDNLEHSSLTVQELLGELQRAATPAAFQLRRGRHAMMLAVDSVQGGRQYLFADPNYGIARFDSVLALQQALSFQQLLLQTQEQQQPFAQHTAPGFGLRKYRSDLAQQTLFSTRPKNRPVLHLNDLCRQEKLGYLFGHGLNTLLDQDPYFLKLKKRLTIAEYRMQIASEERPLQGTPLNDLLEETLRKHTPGRNLETRLLRLSFRGPHASVLLGTPSLAYPQLQLEIDGSLHPQDVGFLRQYHYFLNKLSGRVSSSLLQLFQPRTRLNLDTLYLASALPEDGFILPEPVSAVAHSARTAAAAPLALPSLLDEQWLCFSRQRRQSEHMAEQLRQATHSLLAQEGERQRWIPLLHTLSRKTADNFQLEFSDRDKPGKTMRRTSSDVRWQEIQGFMQQQVGKLQGAAALAETAADPIDGLNSAFAIQAMMRWLYHRDDASAAEAGLNRNLALALQIQSRIGLGQIALGTLKDMDNLRRLLSRALRAEASIATRLLSTSSSGLQLFSTLLDVYQLSQADDESQKAVFATHLAFDSAGLGLGALEFAGLEVELLGGSFALAEITGPLGVIVAGVALGGSALAENFAALTRSIQSVGRHFQTFHDNYQAGGYRYDTEKQLLDPLPLVAISTLDFRQGRVDFGSPRIYASRFHGILHTPNLDHDRAHAFDLRQRMGLPASATLQQQARNAARVLLPVCQPAWISYGYKLMAACTSRHDTGFDLLRSIEGADFTFDCYEFFEYAIGQLDFEYQVATLQVLLDAQNRSLLLPDPPHGTVPGLRYALLGGAACYAIHLKPGCHLSLASDDAGLTEWRLNTSGLSGTFNATCKGTSIEISVGDSHIRIADIRRVGRIKILDQNQAQHELVLEDGHLEPMELDASQWSDPGQQVHDWLTQHKIDEHYLLLDGYRPAGGRSIARAYLDIKQDKYLYIDDHPSYPEARLITQIGEHVYFYAGERQQKILQVDARSHRVDWIYAAQQSGHRLRLQTSPTGLFVEQDTATGGLPVYRLDNATLVLLAIRDCPALIDRLASETRVGRLRDYLPPLLTLANSTQGQSHGNQTLPCAFAPWVALDAPQADQISKRALWLQSSDGQVLRARLPPQEGRNPDWVDADLQLVASDKTESGAHCFLFYGARAKMIYRQEGSAADSSQANTAQPVSLPAALAHLSLVAGRPYATLADGRIGVIDGAGQFALHAVNRQYLADHPQWWRPLLALVGNGSLSVLDLKDADGVQALRAWCHDGKLVIVDPELPATVQLFGLDSERHCALLYDPGSLTRYHQPLLTESALLAAFAQGSQLLPGQTIPAARVQSSGISLTLLGNTLSLRGAAADVPLIRGVTQLLFTPQPPLRHWSITQTLWSHYQSMVCELDGAVEDASLPALELRLDNPLVLSAERDGHDLLLLDRANGKSLLLTQAFTAAGVLRTPVRIQLPDASWLELGANPAAPGAFSSDQHLDALLEPDFFQAVPPAELRPA